MNYLVGLVGSSGSKLALLAGSELGKITVVVTLPRFCSVVSSRTDIFHRYKSNRINIHLVVEDLGLAGSSVGDEGVVEDIEDILADLLELGLDLLAVVTDGADVLLGSLGLLFLLDGGDDSPRGTAGADNVLVGDRQEVALINGELTAQLGNLLHVSHHLIVALSLLAEASEEGLAVEG